MSKKRAKKKKASPKIRDNKSFKEMDYQMKSIKRLGSLMSEQQRIKLMIQEAQFKELRQLPDKFNSLFANKGWIAYESMHLPTLKEAVRLGRQGKVDEAEVLLTNYYSEENVKFLLSRLKGIEEYRDRIYLTYKVLDDYLAGRYYACVPVLLMMIDGFVNDLGNLGFFATNVNLSAWDSIAAHHTGLQQLQQVMNKSIMKTSSEPVSIPYRNGILHGRILNYDSQVSAAKCWATLFAIGDLARSIKAGKREEEQFFQPPTFQENISGLIDVVDKIRENEQQQKAIENWEPRSLIVGENVPSTGNPSDYQDESPERCMADYLTYLSKGNYGKVAMMTTKISSKDTNISRQAGELRNKYEGITLSNWAFIEIRDTAPAVTEIDAKLTFTIQDQRTVEKDQTFRILYQDTDDKVLVRGSANGQWKLLDNFRFEFLND